MGTDDLPEYHKRAIARAKAERKEEPGARVSKWQRRVWREEAAGDRQLRDCRTEDPLGMVIAAQRAYREFENTSLLSGYVRQILTADYEKALDAVRRSGQRSRLRNATWPPRGPLDDEKPYEETAQ